MYDDPRRGVWIAPPDYTARWDDEGYSFPESHEIGVMYNRSKNCRHGYVFHAACWSLLEKFYHPKEIPVERLLRVCESLPFPLRTYDVFWGHDYVGLLCLDDKHHFPWEDRIMEWGDDSLDIFQLAGIDPIDVPEVPRLLSAPSQNPPGVLLSSDGNDCFSVLPWEIRCTIAVYLPTKDVLRLRRASRSFSPIFYEQIFWASRFEVGRERAFLFEKRNNKEARDWRTLYRLTNAINGPLGLKNRKRIWDLLTYVPALLSLQAGGAISLHRDDPILSHLHFHGVAGYVRHPRDSSNPYARFHGGCRLLHEKYCFVDNNLSQLIFSTIELGHAHYICGIRLVANQRPDILLGYEGESNRTTLKCTVIKGLVLAMDSGGIRALQVINGDGTASRWIGNPLDTPVTRRLVASAPVHALTVGYDVSNLI